MICFLCITTLKHHLLSNHGSTHDNVLVFVNSLKGTAYTCTYAYCLKYQEAYLLRDLLWLFVNPEITVPFLFIYVLFCFGLKSGHLKTKHTKFDTCKL